MLAPACFVCLVAAVTAAPATFDQRQDGNFNVRADVQNVVLLVAVPEKMSLPLGIFTKSAKQGEHEIQQRSDFRVMEAFVEPSTPYHVEIGGGGEREADGNGREIEVVIAGRRRLGVDPQAEPDNEFKLLGATEQCGPDRERDPASLTCRARSQGPRPDTDNTLSEKSESANSETQEDDVKKLASDPVPEVVPTP